MNSNTSRPVRHKRSTLKLYAELFRNPGALFEGLDVRIYPNGERELWIRDPHTGQGFRITASRGPAGVGLHVSRFACGSPITVGGNLAPNYAPAHAGDFAELELCQYDDTERAQAFKRWYSATPEERAAQGIERPNLEPTRRERAERGEAF